MPISVSLRHCDRLLAGLLAVVLSAVPAAAQPKPTAAASKSTAVKVTTQVLRAEGDGFPIHISYYEADAEKNGGQENAPVIVLLHGEDGSRLIWDKSSAPQGGKPFAEVLNSLGYAVVAVDLRKHGESLSDGQARVLDNNDFYKMAYGDLPSVKKFLVEQHEAKKLNVNKLGIVASDSIGPVAMEFADADWHQTPYLDGPGGTPGTPRGRDVRAIVLLSPVLSVGRVNGTKSANFLKGQNLKIAVAIVAGTRDAEDKNSASKLHQIFSSVRQNAERIEFIRPNTNARGTDLLANPAAKIEPPILAFLDKHVRKLDSPWQTRKSRYDRDTPAE